MRREGRDSGRCHRHSQEPFTFREIMQLNRKFLTGVLLSEQQVFINFAMESMGIESMPIHSGDVDDPCSLKEANA